MERQRLCEAYGARLVFTDAFSGSDGAMLHVREMVAAEPDRYFYADQYRNPANPLAHYRTTGPEIWEQTGGRITHFVAGLGTTGTIVGTGRYLHERNPRVRVVAVEPDEPLHGLEGLKHMPSAIVPEIYDPRRGGREAASVRPRTATPPARRSWTSDGLLRRPLRGRRALGRARGRARARSGAVVVAPARRRRALPGGRPMKMRRALPEAMLAHARERLSVRGLRRAVGAVPVGRRAWSGSCRW